MISSRSQILVVDDNVVNRTVAFRLLRKQDYEVTLACSGRAALAALANDHFDVVLRDVQMPEMDDFETTAAIRDKETLTGGHIPIIAMTAHALKGDQERCLSAGMDGYISKPIRTDEMYATIETVIAGNAAQWDHALTSKE
jgi:two-component system, sensor histidine kinase and response regulator